MVLIRASGPAQIAAEARVKGVLLSRLSWTTKTKLGGALLFYSSRPGQTVPK